MSDLSHSALVESLAEQFRDVQHRLVFTGVGLGSRWLQGGSVPTPDVFTIQKSYTKPAMSIYECKGTVADFRHEITSGKWAKYRPFCNRLYFATPSGLVKKTDIPEGCGWITLGPKGWSVRLSPVYNADAKLDDWEWMSLVFSGRKERLRIRKLEERVIAAANLRSSGYNVVIGERVAQALQGAQQATMASDRERRRCEDLFETAAECLGLNADELREDPYGLRQAVKRRCAGPINAKVEAIARCLLDIAEDGVIRDYHFAQLSEG